MKAYRELAVDVGHSDLQELKYPELRHYEPGGKEASLAGKMRTRSKYSQHNKRSPKGMNLPQADYLGGCVSPIATVDVCFFVFTLFVCLFVCSC